MHPYNDSFVLRKLIAYFITRLTRCTVIGFIMQACDVYCNERKYVGKFFEKTKVL